MAGCVFEGILQVSDASSVVGDVMSNVVPGRSISFKKAVDMTKGDARQCRILSRYLCRIGNKSISELALRH